MKKEQLINNYQELHNSQINLIKARNKFNRVKTKHQAKHDSHDKQYFDILRTMGLVELRCIDETDVNNKLNLHMNNKIKPSFRPYGRFHTPKIKNLKFKEDYVLIKYEHYEDWGEGDGKNHFYKVKIPYEYFEMTTEEIEEAHKKWTLERIESMYTNITKKREDEALKKRKAQYEELKKEFES